MIKKASRYDEIHRLYRKIGLENFIVFTTHLFDMGFKTAAAITDDDIAAEMERTRRESEKAKQEGFVLLITPEFVEASLRFCRDFAQKYTAVDLIQFFEVEQIYETKEFTGEEDEEE